MYCLLEGALSVKGYGSALSVILKVPLGQKGGEIILLVYIVMLG